MDALQADTDRVQRAAEARLSGNGGRIFMALQAAGYSLGSSKKKKNQRQVQRRVDEMRYEQQISTPSVKTRLTGAGVKTSLKFLFDKAKEYTTTPWKTTAVVNVINRFASSEISIASAKKAVKRRWQQTESESHPTKRVRLHDPAIAEDNEVLDDFSPAKLLPNSLFSCEQEALSSDSTSSSPDPPPSFDMEMLADDPCQGCARQVDSNVEVFAYLRRSMQKCAGDPTKHYDNLKNHEEKMRSHPNCNSFCLVIREQDGLCITRDDTSGNGDVIETIRSVECTYAARLKTASGKATIRCEACHANVKKVKKKLYAIQQEKETIHPKENISIIDSPRRLSRSLVECRAELSAYKDKERNRKAREMARKVKAETKKGGVRCRDKEKADAIYQTYVGANDAVQEQFQDPADPSRQLWNAHFELMMEYKANKFKKNKGIRFDPLVFNFAMGLLAKTSNQTYEMVAEVLYLPSARQVKRKQTELAGKNQGSVDGLCKSSIFAMDAAYTKKGYLRGLAHKERSIAISFDSTQCRDGCHYDLNDDFVGLDSSVAFNVISNKFIKMANKARDDGTVEASTSAETSTPEQNFEENLSNIAKHHLVMIASSLSGDIPPYVVASQNLAEMTSFVLLDMLSGVVKMLHYAGFRVCLIVGDGATENVSLFSKLSTERSSDYIGKGLQKEFPDIDFGLNVVWKHPLTDEPIFVLEDMPHVVKRVVNAMERSSLKNSKRNLKYSKFQPINLESIKTVWLLTGGGGLNLQSTKLTNAHFVKDAFSRMRVPLAVQVLSSSVADMLEKALEDPSVQTSLRNATSKHYTQYKRQIEFIRHMNNLVDICNGRDPKQEGCKAPFTKATGLDIQRRLLEILQFMSKWKAEVERDVTLDATNFFADATWTGIRRVILGYVGLIEYYCLTCDLEILGRRTNSDPCEHYFARGRASFGSTNSGDTRAWNTHRIATTAFNEAKQHFVPPKSNNANAPTESRQIFKGRLKY